jgi:hypothetical protein
LGVGLLAPDVEGELGITIVGAAVSRVPPVADCAVAASDKTRAQKTSEEKRAVLRMI